MEDMLHHGPALYLWGVTLPGIIGRTPTNEPGGRIVLKKEHGLGGLVLCFLGRRCDLVLRLLSQVLHLVHRFVRVLLDLVLVHRDSDVPTVAVAARREMEPPHVEAQTGDNGHD